MKEKICVMWVWIPEETSSDQRRREGREQVGERKLSPGWLGTKEEPWRQLSWPSSPAIIATLQYEFGWKTTWQPKSEIPLTHIYQVACSKTISDPENADCFITTRI